MSGKLVSHCGHPLRQYDSIGQLFLEDCFSFVPDFWKRRAERGDLVGEGRGMVGRGMVAGEWLAAELGQGNGWWGNGWWGVEDGI